MLASQTAAPLVLFFDCYIISSRITLDEAHGHRDASVGNVTKAVRVTPTVYRAVSKLTEVMYTLLSYRAVPWQHMVLRVECEDEADRVAFFDFARVHFPDAQLLNQRSATAAQYVQALQPLQNLGDPWVFFSPNNDHPLVGDPHAFGPLIQLAQDIEPLFPEHFVSILYSHFTESQNCALPDQFNWGRMMGNTYHVMGETPFASVVKSSLFTCDSIKIYRLSALIKMFAWVPHTERCIRLEDTGLYLSKTFREITLFPKAEICRHFDGYPHIDLAPPPLFVPPGFFESSIKVRYGYPLAEEGCVNVNPYEEYSYLGGSADMRCLLSELPAFWQGRIASVDVNPAMHTLYADRLDEAFRFDLLRNPYSDGFVLTNYMRSGWNAIGYPAKEFDESRCSTMYVGIPAERTFVDKSTATTANVYFVLSGTMATGVMQFRKHDFLIVQGDAEFALQAGDTPTQLLKVTIQGGGPPMLKYCSWRKM